MSLWEVKDIKAKPIQGRAFPVSFSVVVRECKTHRIDHQTGKRVQIAMRNLKSKSMKEKDWLLAELRPKEELTIYSVPKHFDLNTASERTLEAIATFAFLNSYPLKQLNSCCQLFQAYLQDDSQLSLSHTFWHYKQPKYRGSMKFSNAFNKKIVKSELKKFQLVDSRIEYK